MGTRRRLPPPRERLKTFITTLPGMTQERAAEELGVSGASLSDWIAGKSNPRAVHRRMIQRWTNGEIAEDEWMTKAERKALAAVVGVIVPERKAV